MQSERSMGGYDKGCVKREDVCSYRVHYDECDTRRQGQRDPSASFIQSSLTICQKLS